MGAQSISKWCSSNGISRGSYYNGRNRQDGSVPLAISVGKRQLITDEEDAAWRKRRQAKAEADTKRNLARWAHKAVRSEGHPPAK